MPTGQTRAMRALRALRAAACRRGRRSAHGPDTGDAGVAGDAGDGRRDKADPYVVVSTMSPWHIDDAVFDFAPAVAVDAGLATDLALPFASLPASPARTSLFTLSLSLYWRYLTPFELLKILKKSDQNLLKMGGMDRGRSMMMMPLFSVHVAIRKNCCFRRI